MLVHAAAAKTMWLQRRRRVVDGIDRRGGNYRSRIDEFLEAHIDISCLANARCLCLARPGFSKRSSFHPPSPANHSARSRSTPKGVCASPPTTKCETLRARGSLFLLSKFMPAYNKTLLNGRFTLSFLVDLFSRCAETILLL